MLAYQNYISGMAEPGGRVVSPQNLIDQLTLSQPRGPPTFLLAPSNRVTKSPTAPQEAMVQLRSCSQVSIKQASSLNT